jgi:SAM-dependent methyltransferase
MNDKSLYSNAPENTSNVLSSPVAAAFDSIANVFDLTLENEVTVRLRKKLYAVIESLISPGSTILDINCGTGIDALYLGSKGFRVVGIDISHNMIAAARRKLHSVGLNNVNFSVCSYDRLSPEHFPAAELVFSNFGGLNCTSDLVSTANAIGSVTKPGGYIVGVLMPPFSLWEFLSFAFRLRWSQALRRLHDKAQATGFRGAEFPVYYHSPSYTRKSFSEQFEFRKLIGLSIVSPTPQSSGFISRFPFVSRILVDVDGMLEGLPLARSVGDHYVIVLQKKQ